MSSKALYIDSYSYETLHEQYNAAMFLVCAYSFDEITYCAGKSSYNHTSKLIDAAGYNNYNTKTIFVVGGESKIFLLFRIIISCFQNIRFLLFSKKENILIYNYNNFFSLLLVNLLNKILKRQIIVFCHSEIAFIVKNCVHKTILYKLRTKILRYFFLSPNTNIAHNLNFVVLGDSIKLNLSKILHPSKIDHFISIDHPYIFKNSLIPKKHQGLKLGVVGTMAQEKGADIIIDIANQLDLKNRNDITISIIGRIICDTRQFQDVGIILPDNLGKESLPRTEFNLKISELDYILYLYPVNSYQFTASGSLMDSVNMQCPAISFRNDYFQYIFEKFGHFGYLVEDISEMVILIKSLSKDNIIKQKYDFDKVKMSLSPSVIKNEFISKLNTIGFI